MTTRAPDTLEPADTWRDRAACSQPLYRGARDMWFPIDADNQARRAAKQICDTCPVRVDCLTEAVNTEGAAAVNARFGVYGGLTPRQRRRIYDKARTNSTTLADEITAALAPGKTMRDLYEEHSAPAEDGHRSWALKSSTITFEGRIYTPMQIAFIVGHGRKPDGMVWALCGMKRCVERDHLADAQLRRERRKATP